MAVGAQSSASTIASPAATHLAGSLVVVGISRSAGVTVTGVTDLSSGANTYHKAGATQTGGNELDLWYAYNIAGVTNNVLTVTFSGSIGYRVVFVQEFTGFGTADPFHAQAGGSGASALMSTGSVSVTGFEAVIVAIFEATGDSITNASPSYNTAPINATGDPTNYFSDGYRLVTAGEAATANCGSNTWIASAASFQNVPTTGYTLTIGGTARNFLPGSLKIDETANGRNNLSIEIPSIDGSYRPTIGDEVLLTEGSTRIFGGIIEQPGESGYGGEGRTAITHRLTVPDFSTYADRRYVSGIIPGGTLKSQLLVLVPYLSFWGVSVDAAQVTGPTMPDIPCDFLQLSQLFDQMATIAGYVWEIDYQKSLKMFAPGSLSAPFNLSTGDAHVIGDITVDHSRADYANRVVLRFTNIAIAAWGFFSVTVNFADTEQVVLGGQTYTFQTVLTNTSGHILIGGSLQASMDNLVDAVINGGNGSSSGSGTPANNKIDMYQTQPNQWKMVASTAGAAGNSLAITTTNATNFFFWEGAQLTATLLGGADEALTGQVEANNFSQQAIYGVWEQIVSAPSVRDWDVATALVASMVSTSVTTIDNVKYTTASTGLHPGQTQTIGWTTRGLSGSYLITDVSISLLETQPRREVTLVGGTALKRRWQDDAKVMLGGSGGGTTLGAFTLATGGGGGGGGLGGSGTTGKIPKWLDPGDLTDSLLTEAGSTVTMAGTLAATTLQGSLAASYITGVLTLAQGGTGAALTASPGAVPYSAASALAFSAVGASGQLFRSTGTTAPGWTSAKYPSSAGGSAGAFIRSDSVDWQISSLLLPNAATANRLVYATGTNQWGESANLTFTGSVLALTGDMTLTGFIGAATYASQTTGWRIDATGGADFRYLFVDEMHAKSFVTDLEMALAGGQIIAKSVAMVAVSFTVPAAGSAQTLRVRDLPSMADTAAFQSGDTVVLRRFTRTSGTLNIDDCVGVVTSYADQTDGTQTWTFTRNASTSGGTMSGGSVAVDSLAIDYGVSGNGYYEVNAIDGTYGANSPYAQIVTWTSSPALSANRVIRTRFGKLDGITGASGEYGMIAGTYAASNGAYFRASSTVFELHGITAKWWHSTTNVVTISPNSGSPYISLGNPAPTSWGSGPGVWIDYDATGGTARMLLYSLSLAKYLAWDGVNLWWNGGNTSMDTAGNLTANNATLQSATIAGDVVVGTSGQIRSGASAFGTTTGWWLDYNGGTPRFRVGDPAGNQLSWDGSLLYIKSGKFTIDSTGHVGLGPTPTSAATLNVASDGDTAATYSIFSMSPGGNFSLATYGDGRCNVGPLYLYPGAWNTTGAGTNPGMQANTPIGIAQPTGWMLVYIYTGSTYDPKWIPAY